MKSPFTFLNMLVNMTGSQPGSCDQLNQSPFFIYNHRVTASHIIGSNAHAQLKHDANN